MKKSFNRLLAVVCIGAMAAVAFLQSFTYNLQAASYYFTGQDSNVTTDLIYDGVDTGVDLTRVHLGSGGSSGYGANRYINIVEGNITSNPKISIEVLNSGTGVSGSAPLTSVVAEYNEGDNKIIAAVNGDWMSSTSGDLGISTTRSYRVSFSAMLTDGEIWCSQMSSQELNADYYTFGVTSEDEVVIGKLTVKTTISNVSKGKTISADGINRAPASGAIYVYNNRLGTSNYVPSDAYEVIIDTSSNKFMNGGTVTGKVVGIYASGTTSRASLTDGRVVITARGSSKISTLKNSFSIGDTVNITTSLYDSMGNNDLWARCEEAIGGQSLVMKNGAINNNLGSNTSQYPSNILGYKADGTVMMAMVTADSNGRYVGLQFNRIPQFCKDIGFDTCILLDGGGSTTMVTIDGGSYVERACYSDGSIRSTWNSVAFVYANTLGNTVYDAEYYRGAHSDLNAAYPNNDTGLYNHFNQNGITEGRQASAIFSVKYYAENNSDLKNAFGTDYKAAMDHFYHFGYKEPRNTAPCEDIGTDFYANILLSYAPNIAVGASEDGNVHTVQKSDASAIWKFTRDSNGTYTITNASQHKVLDVFAGQYFSGANIALYESNNTNAQKWFIYKSIDGNYILRSKCSPSCVMDVNGAASSAGANIQNYTYNSSNAQEFNIVILFKQSDCEFEFSNSSDYEFGEYNSQLSIEGVSAGTTPDDFKAQFLHDCTVYNTKNEIITSGRVCSGYTAKKIINGVQVASAIIIVEGDYNGDGIAGTKDLIKIKKQISGGDVIGYQQAVDFNNNGEVDKEDLKALAALMG